MKRCLWAAGLSLGLGAALPGCVAHARGEMVYEPNEYYSDDYVYPTEYVAVVPARIEHYPHTYYQGRPAYLADGRWYYQNQQRWVVFREEPAHLRQYRLNGADHGRSAHSSYPRHAAGQRLIEQRRQEQREQEHRAERHRQEQAREQERRAEQHRQEQAREQERRAEQHRQGQERRHEQRATSHGEADRRVAERRRGNRERERDRAEQERRPTQHGRRDQRDDRRDD